MKQNGLAPIVIVIFIALVLSTGGYLIYKQKVTPTPQKTAFPSLSPSPESAVKNRQCLSKDPSLFPVYKCDSEIYKIPPGGPGMGMRYLDQKGNVIATCGGSAPNIKESEKCKSLELLKCGENICDNSDETVDWKTYTDGNNNFSFKYPDFAKIVNIKEAYKETDKKADISVSFSPSSPVDSSIADKIFQLSIQVINNTDGKTAEEYVQELNTPNYKVSDIKPYETGQIEGVYYKALDQTMETSQLRELIIVTRRESLFRFEYEAWNGAFVKERGKETVQQILSTFKFLDNTYNWQVDCKNTINNPEIKYKECEMWISSKAQNDKRLCEEIGGKYVECASPCRHLSSQTCITACVKLCTFQ